MPVQRHITLRIGAHHLPFTIDASLEEDYRRAAVLLNQRYDFYQQQLPKASVELIWVYVALEMSINYSSDARTKNIAPILAKLTSMNQQIEQTLQQDNKSDN